MRLKYIFFFIIFNNYCAFSFVTKFMECVKINPRNIDKTKKIYIINLDDTICFMNENDCRLAIPIYDNIKIFNKLYDKGNEINYWTRRELDTNKNYEDFTVRQLEFWNVKYDKILVEKKYDIIIDKNFMSIDEIKYLDYN